MRLLSLDEVGPRDRARIGGKGAGLATLAAYGLPVPGAVIVPTEVFRDFLRENRLWERARRGGDPGLSADVLAGRLDPAFAGELREAAARLGGRLAVRSSAVAEDSQEATYAGQFSSFLGVLPGDETEAAVRGCWASAFGERALAYRRSHGEASVGAPCEMAVVVQRLVAARCAGVMFTVNPLNGSWREMTVEAAWGLGEAVVEGRVVPDFYRVRRPRRSPRPVQRLLARVRLEVVENQVRPQQTRWAVASGGTAEMPVPAQLRDAPKLNRSDLLRLCRLGLRSEALLGGPQDVEWAQDDQGRFFVLQSRPVTTARDVRRSGPVIWTRRFVGERWTGPATPLGWSEMHDLLEWFVAYPATSRRYLGGEEATRQFRFAPYFNVTLFRHLAFKLPGAPPPRFMVELLPPEEESGWLRRHAQAPDLRVYRAILAETVRERRWERFRWNPLTNYTAWAQFEGRLDAALAGISEQPANVALAREAIVASRALAREYVKVHICSLLFANIWFQLAEGALAADGREDLVAVLLRSPSENWTVRTNQALWRLGRGEIDLAAFLARFGHRAGSSWELFNPRWQEAPSAAVALARTIAQGAEPVSVAGLHAEASERALEQDLSVHTRWLVGITRKYLQLREDQRYHFDRILWRWKRAWLRIEHDLDLEVRYLEVAEADALLSGDLARADAMAMVQRRRLAWEEELERRARGDEPPAFLVGEEAVEQVPEGLRLQGMGISAGVVTGPVRVVRTLEEASRLREGEILVTRATDPGWTPLFLRASGLVMELGGMLSHGAVVAREYRLPAVVNVAGATRTLKDGQVITVDGGRGVVWVR